MRFAVLSTLLFCCTQSQFIVADDAEAEGESIKYAEKNGIRVSPHESETGKKGLSLHTSDTVFGSDDVKALMSLKKINHVHICGGITPEGLELLVKLPTLEEIGFKPEFLNDEVLAILAKTKSIHLLRRAFPKVPKYVQLRGDGGISPTDTPTTRTIPATDDQVTCLDLSKTPVTDSGLKFLTELKNLRELRLNETKVTDAGMKVLPKFKKLERLNLSRMEITDKGLVELSPLQGLNELDLSETNIGDEGVHELSEHKNITTLDLSETLITNAALKSIAKLPKLFNLDLSKTATTAEGFQHLASLKNLKVLDLHPTQMNDEAIVYFAKAKLLHLLPITYSHPKDQATQDKDINYLYLKNITISDETFALLLKFTKLEEIFCSQHQLTDNWLKLIIKAEKLHCLFAYGTGTSPTQVAQASEKKSKNQASIDTIRLRDAQVTGAIFAELKRIPKLLRLDIVCTKDSDISVKDLAKLEFLERLEITGGKIGFEDSVELDALKKFTELRLTEVDVSEQGWQAIGTLKSLKELYLNKTALSFQGARELSKLEGFIDLYIVDDSFKSDNLKDLLPLKQLQHLGLICTPIINNDLKVIASFTNLKSLRFFQCPIDHKGVKHLAELKQLKVLDLPHESLTDELFDKVKGTSLFTPILNGLCESVPRWYEGDPEKAKTSKYINLIRTPLTDKGLHHLKNIPNLVALQLYAPQISPEGLKSLQDSNIEVIVFEKMEVSDEMITVLSKFKSLKEIRIRGDTGFEDWVKLRKGLKKSINLTRHEFLFD